jgi:hypothetical protein
MTGRKRKRRSEKDKPRRKEAPIKRTTTQGSSVMGDHDDERKTEVREIDEIDRHYRKPKQLESGHNAAYKD